MFLGQGLLLQPLLQRAAALHDSAPASATAGSQDTGTSLSTRVAHLKRTLSEAGTAESGEAVPAIEAIFPDQRTSKARRIDDSNDAPSLSAPHPTYSISDVSECGLPPDDLIDSLAELYFLHIHPWIPILHVREFRQSLRDTTRRAQLVNVFHAIVSVCVRFSDDSRLGDYHDRARISKQSRQRVILQSMEKFSVENLQAMVIVAFDTVRY
jgi:hypothetical protein